MEIDRSTYYPEVPGGDGYSLNRQGGGLFGAPEPDEGDRVAAQRASRFGDDNARDGIGTARDGVGAPSSGNYDGVGAPSSGNKDSEETDAERVVSGFSHFLSWVLVPLMMPVYGLVLAFGLSILEVVPMHLRVVFTLIVAGINVVVPMCMVLLLKKLGVVADLGLNGQKERLIPYIISIVCLGVTGWFMATKGAPAWLSLFFAGGAVGALVNMVVNFWWKISAHSAGIAGIVALLMRIEKDGSPQPELWVWLMVVIGVAGLLGSARVWLGRHTVWQVLAGYAVGFCSVFFVSSL